MMLLALLMFTIMGISIRLASAQLHVFEIVFFRNALAVVIMAPVMFRMGRESIRMHRPRLYYLRAAINFSGMLCGFTAVTLIPLAEMTALSFTGPIFVTIGAAMFLGEVIRIRRMVAIAVGFVGAVIILRPGFVDISLGTTLALCSALSIAGASLVVKKMTDTENARHQHADNHQRGNTSDQVTVFQHKSGRKRHNSSTSSESVKNRPVSYTHLTLPTTPYV